MTEMTDESSGGPSLWERNLYAHLIGHVQTERSLLEKYREATERSPSKALRYLVNLLIEDEIRHHRIFAELAESLKTSALLGDDDPIIPDVDFRRDDQEATLALTQELLENEEQDARDLQRLQRELREVKNTTLWSLLVELMERDTQKHIALLRFVKGHAGRR
jgi:rubrerythrin